MLNERGIILSPLKIIKANTKETLLNLSRIDPGLLRWAILYWDKVVCLNNNLLHMQYQKDIKVLVDARVIQLENVEINELSADFVKNKFHIAHIDVFSDLNRQNPGMWTMGKYGQEFLMPQENVVKKEILEIEINNILPAPPSNFDLEKLLKFKDRRRGEIQALRVAIDELYNYACSWDNIDRGRIYAIAKLDAAINDIRKIVGNEWFNRQISYKNIISLGSNVISDFVKYSAMGKTFGHAASAGLLAAGIRVMRNFKEIPTSDTYIHKSMVALYYIQKSLLS